VSACRQIRQDFLVPAMDTIKDTDREPGVLQVNIV
jgi:hypothetical protein